MSELDAKMRKVHWVPLESNPDMLTDFASKVGLPKGWEFVDVLGTDPELLGMVPPGSVAVTLLFQCSEKLSKFKEEQKAKIDAGGQSLSTDLVYLKQYVGNACGTIACLHSLANNAQVLGLTADSPIGKFLATASKKTPEEAGAMLADATELHHASDASAAQGQTAAPQADADTDCHFVCFIEKGGDVYELDGNKAFPINHGPTQGDLLNAAAKVVKTKFMETDPDNIHFNMMALVKPPEES